MKLHHFLTIFQSELQHILNLVVTVASETLEGMFFLDFSVNITHRKTMIGTKVKNYLCDLFQ